MKDLKSYPYKVLVRVDDKGRLLELNSDAFIKDKTGWIEIDSGCGDRYHHAQMNYLTRPLVDNRGLCLYKIADGKIVERAQDEIDADYQPPQPTPTVEQRLTVLESSTDDIILMLADMIGG